MHKTILNIAVPTIMALLLNLFVEIINMAFVGHLGDTAKVAGVGLGNMYINIFCLSVINGINGALATLVSQAFGSGNMRQCGIFLNRGRIVAMITFIFPMIALF